MAKGSPRARRERAPQSTVPAWAKVAGGFLLLLAALHFTIIWRVGRFADQLTGAISALGSASHGGGYYTWEGDLGIRRFRVESANGEAHLSVKGLELDTPNWWWTLQLVNPLSTGGDEGRILGRASTDARLPPARQLHLRLRGIDLEVNSLLPPGMPNLGFAAATLFETAGCSNVRYFVPLNLSRDLRLPYRQTDLSLGYVVMGPDSARIEFVLEAPGVVTTRFELDVRTNQPERLLAGVDPALRVSALRMVFEDHGFVAARNQWCAEQAGIDADEFQRRHLSTVRRLLEVYGVRLSPETESVYQAYARDGGRLVIAAELPDSFDVQRFSALRGEQILALLGARIRHGEAAAVPMTLDFIKPRPLPRAYSGSVWDLLERAEDNARTAEVAPLGVLGERVRALLHEEDEAAAKAPEAPLPRTPPAPEPPAPIELALDPSSLQRAIGQTIEIITATGQRIEGELLAVTEQTITIQRQVSGGRAALDYELERLQSVAIIRPARARG